MKPFSKLTRIGQIRRLRQVALQVLKDYDIAIAWVKLLADGTNTLFRVRSVVGESFVVRIYSDEETTLRENQAEMFWLSALVRDTDIRVSEPVPRRDGDYLTLVSIPGVAPDRRCAVFKWIPGRPLENYLNTDTYFNYGQTMAQLHDHAMTLNPLPDNVQPKTWDQVFYYPNDPIIYNQPEYSHLFPSSYIQIIESVIDQAEAVLTQLYSGAEKPILLHGDLHYWNVHYYRGQLYVLDFEDIMLGYPVQDVAITLYYGRHMADYPALREAFRQGYSTMRPWPATDERIIETLIAARTVMFINYAARLEDSPETYIQQKCDELAKFLK